MHRGMTQQRGTMKATETKGAIETVKAETKRISESTEEHDIHPKMHFKVKLLADINAKVHLRRKCISRPKFGCH